MHPMGLHDHFRPPLSDRRHWHSFHHGWATLIAASLNQLLPPQYFAEPNVQFGIEIDVATFEDPRVATGGAGVAVETSTAPAVTWTAPSPTLSVPFPLVGESAEVHVYSTVAGPVLAGAIELVSPANKDRPSNRESFVSKCEGYLQRAVGLVVVDIVTARTAHLHQQLLDRVAPGTRAGFGSALYAASYRTVERQQRPSLDVWEEAVHLGGILPVMPLWLPGDLCLPVDLAATYERTCRELRVPVDQA